MCHRRFVHLFLRFVRHASVLLLVFGCAPLLRAQFGVRQAVGVIEPNQNCTVDATQNPPAWSCTPQPTPTLTVNFAPTLPGDTLIVTAGMFEFSANCTDNLGQQWVRTYLGDPQTQSVSFASPPSGAQTAGITSLTCGTYDTSTALGVHLLFIEMSGVSSAAQVVSFPVQLTSGVAGSCGSVGANAVGLFVPSMGASYGGPNTTTDPGPPSPATLTSNIAAGTILSMYFREYVTQGVNSPSYYQYGLNAPESLYVVTGTQGASPTFTVTNTNQGASQGCAAVEFPRSNVAADPGPCDECEAVAGQPINLTTGDVWVTKTDYSVPGLAGGLSLTRTWNSLWNLNSPPFMAGMFGTGWTSNFEERLQVIGSGAIEYWRGNGSTWNFVQPNGCSTCAYNVAAPTNQHASLAYNSSTSLYTLTFIDGTTKAFNSSGYLTAITDRNANNTTITYDGSNRITKVTAPGGQSLAFSYGLGSDPNRVTSIQDSVGNVATYSYSNSLLMQAAYPDGGQLNYAYDAHNNITSVTDDQGKTIEAHTYDSGGHGLISARANGVDAVTVQYAPAATTLTNSMNNSTTYNYGTIATRNFMTGIQGPGCDSCGGRNNQTFTLDASGNRQSTTDPNGNKVSYSYDSSGNVLTRTDAVGTWTYTYNGFNEVLTAKDPLGNTTTNTYDTNGNLLTTTTPSPGGSTAGSKTTFTYDTKGELLTITDPNGNKTSISYFSSGLVQTVTDALKSQNSTSYAYDGRGNRLTVIDALSNNTSFSYDPMNRLTKITYQDATTMQFAYDKRGRRISVTDQNNKTTQYAYDDADRLVTVADPATHVTTYGYNTESNLTSIKDANTNTTTFSYDFLGRVTKTLFPSNLFETYGYDNDGNLTSKTDRNNHTISYTYDQLNRLKQKSYPDSTTVNYTYDNDSRLTQVVDPTGTYSFTYDNMGRLTQTSSQYSFLTAKTFTSAYGYDAASNRTSYTDPESGSTTYAFDVLNRLQTLTPPTAFARGSFGFTYDAINRRTQLTRPNGVSTTYAYDSLSHLLSVKDATSKVTLDGASYGLDAAGNRISRTPLPSGTATNYGYDAIYEVLSATQGTTTKESYTYDAVGNRLTSLSGSYVENTSNEMTSSPNATYTYDYNGNTTSKADSTGTTNCSWDFENRLTSVTLPGSGGTVSFKYDPFGRRIYKSSSSGTSIYAYDQGNVIEEVNGSGAVVARYSQGLNIDEPLAMLRNSTTSYYHADGLGSITSLSSSAGSIAQTYGYDAFGKQTSSSGSLTNPFQYTARESDSETGLYYYRARYYDSSTGRFLSEDPIGFDGGENFYRYAQNSPLVWIDPSGNGPICFSVTPKGMTEIPCADPKGGTSCIYVPGGVSCRVPIPPGPPPAPNPDFANPYNCPCHPLNLMIESEKILLEQKATDQGTSLKAGATTAALQAVERILEHLGAGTAAELVPILDLILLGNDAREIHEHGVEAQKKLDKLFAPCRH